MHTAVEICRHGNATSVVGDLCAAPAATLVVRPGARSNYAEVRQRVDSSASQRWRLTAKTQTKNESRFVVGLVRFLAELETAGGSVSERVREGLCVHSRDMCVAECGRLRRLEIERVDFPLPCRATLTARTLERDTAGHERTQQHHSFEGPQHRFEKTVFA